MGNIIIREILSIQIEQYKKFLVIGSEEETLLITPKEIINSPFPTKDRNDSFTIGAYFNKVLAGVSSFTRDGEDREKLRHKGILFTMYVSKEFRGLGISKQLLEAVINRVKMIPDIEQINLVVLSENVIAKKLYEKFGFEKYGTEQNSIKWQNKYFAEDQMVLRLK